MFPEWRYEPWTENPGEISELTDRRGRILFNFAPGTDEAAANGMYVAAFHAKSASSTSYIKLYFSANNTLKLEFMDRAGSARSDTWDCTGALAHDGTTYDAMIEYDNGYMKLWIDNSLKITLSYDVRFGPNAVPDYYTLGTDIAGANAYTSTVYTYPTMAIYDYGAAQK